MKNEDTLYAFCAHKNDPRIHLRYGRYYVRYINHSFLAVNRPKKSLDGIDEVTKKLFGIDDRYDECLIVHPDPHITAKATLLVLKAISKGRNSIKVVNGEPFNNKNKRYPKVH